MERNKNVILAIALAAAVLFLWQYFVATPSMKAEQARQALLEPVSQAATEAVVLAEECYCSRDAVASKRSRVHG